MTMFTIASFVVLAIYCTQIKGASFFDRLRQSTDVTTSTVTVTPQNTTEGIIVSVTAVTNETSVTDVYDDFDSRTTGKVEKAGKFRKVTNTEGQIVEVFVPEWFGEDAFDKPIEEIYEHNGKLISPKAAPLAGICDTGRTTGTLGERSVCPWVNGLNTDYYRKPVRIMQAYCSCRGPCSSSSAATCQPLSYNIPVQRYSNGRYTDSQQNIVVACVCAHG